MDGKPINEIEAMAGDFERLGQAAILFGQMLMTTAKSIRERIERINGEAHREKADNA